MKQVLILIGLLMIAACSTPQDAVSGTPFRVISNDSMHEQSNATRENGAQPVGEPIKMGAIMPLTGDGAVYGESLSRQLLLAVKELNENGGINGRPVEIILEDGKCNPKDAAVAAKKLISLDKVKVIFGGVCSEEMLGAAPIAEKEEVIMISPSATSPDITTAGDYIFRTAPSDAFAGGVAAQAAFDLGFRKMVIISENTNYGQGLHRVFKDVFEALGGTIVLEERYNTEDEDFKTALLKIRKVKPEGVYIVPQTPAKGVQLLRQMKEQGIDAPRFTGEVLLDREIVNNNLALFEGMTGVEPAFDQNGSVAKTVLAQYKEAYGNPVFPFFQAAMRDAFYLVANAVKEHGYDASNIRDALYQTKNWNGAIGRLTFDENGDPILKFNVKQLQDGKLVNLK